MEYLVVKIISLLLMFLTITSGRPQNEYGNYDNNQNNNYYDSRSLDYNDIDSDQQNVDGYDSNNYENSEDLAKPYNFRYTIKDDQSGTDFGQTETSDGQVIKGEYRVQLPDGRYQVVKYTADWENGYRADVTYEGEAYYPDASSQHNAAGDGFQGYGNEVEEEYSQNNHELGNSSPSDAIYRRNDDLVQVFRQDSSVYDDAVSNPLPQYGSNEESFDGNFGNGGNVGYGGRL